MNPFTNFEVLIKHSYQRRTEFIVEIPKLSSLYGDAANQLVMEQRAFIEQAIREKLARQSARAGGA